MAYCPSVFSPHSENNVESFMNITDEYDPEYELMVLYIQKAKFLSPILRKKRKRRRGSTASLHGETTTRRSKYLNQLNDYRVNST